MATENRDENSTSSKTWAIFATVILATAAAIYELFVQQSVTFGLPRLWHAALSESTVKGWHFVVFVALFSIIVTLPTFLLLRSLFLRGTLRNSSSKTVHEVGLRALPDLAYRDHDTDERNLGLRWLSLKREQENLSERLQGLDRVMRLDSHFLNLLPDLVPLGDENSQSREAQMRGRMRKFLDSFLREAEQVLQVFDSRASMHIFHPDPEKEDELISWERYELQNDQRGDMRFSITQAADADPSKRCGIAGQAFIDGKTRVVHLSKNQEGVWEADNNDYVFRHPRTWEPSYVTMAATPITLEQKALGVLTVNTRKPDAFDTEGAQEILEILANRIGAAMSLYNNMREEGANRLGTAL